jgi:hypothetical protein
VSWEYAEASGELPGLGETLRRRGFCSGLSLFRSFASGVEPEPSLVPLVLRDGGMVGTGGM